MSNFVSNANATDLMEAIGTKKLTVTDVMPTASADNIGIPYLYLGATTQDYSNGSIYKCQEVTPATDPKTYEYVEIYVSNVDLSKYKRIWGGTEAAWDLLTDEEKSQYEYCFFDGDSADYFAVVDAVTDGDMHAVTSNAVYDYTVDAVTDGNMHPVTSNAVYDEIYHIDNDALSNFNANIIKIGNMKFLHLKNPKNAMTYNVAYNCGSLNSKYYPIAGCKQNFNANDREYILQILTTGEVTITAKSNTLPVDGKPSLVITIPFL